MPPVNQLTRKGFGNMFSTLKALVRNEDGATMVEYGLLIALVALVAITAVKALGTSVSSLFNAVAGSI